MAKVTSHLWFEKDARAAVDFYVSVVPDSRILGDIVIPGDSPSGPEGAVKVIEFTLSGENFMALEAGPLEAFNHAYSVMVELDDQAEIDRLWTAFLGNGGTSEQCGWLRDRWGLSWQIVPRVLNEMMAAPDRDAARRATEAMLKMVKLEIAPLEAAFAGRGAA